MDFENLDIEIPTSDDFLECAEIIIKVSDGILNYALDDLARKFGVIEIADLISMQMLDQSLFNKDNITLLTLDKKIIGLMLSYPELLNRQFLTQKDSVIHFSENIIALFNSVLYYELDDEISKSYYVNTLYVDSNYRNQNLGKLLIEIAKEKARTFQCDSIVLHVFEDNINALMFYQKIGFKIVKKVSYPQDFKYHQQGLVLKLSI